MPVVVPVKFAFASRDLWFDPQGLDIVEADHAICSTERGTEIGLVTADPFEVPEDELSAPLKPVLRIATDDDLDYADELAQRGDDAMEDFRRLVKQNELDMKPVGVEYLFGGEKVVFYFAAEDRVDFRQLVKDLSSCFHTRIDMRQIGVRDETRLVGGYAHCGQELCCTRFGGQFEPVSIRMAKEQDLPLNSAKISGVCGRLMCCLRYEFEAYKDFKSRAPKKKTLIDPAWQGQDPRVQHAARAVGFAPGERQGFSCEPFRYDLLRRLQEARRGAGLQLPPRLRDARHLGAHRVPGHRACPYGTRPRGGHRRGRWPFPRRSLGARGACTPSSPALG